MADFSLESPTVERKPLAAPGLSDEQRRALARLQNRKTSYEAEIVRADGQKRLFVYTDARSQRGLLNCLTGVRQVGVSIFLGIPTSELFMSKGRNDKTLHVVNRGGRRLGHFIRFTGRTRRDVIMENNPLPYVAEGLK